ncbi:MAG: PAS domain S-box protein, partial [Deltaproteobacteria bacterium]|nr:PAS domain S-box protein [Deltaproteobacteria bacterium]
MANKPTYEELEQRVKELENGTLAPKRSEEAIQLSAERFHRLFEQASDAFFIHDFNNGKIVDANESACKHLGYTRDELLELDVSDIEIGDSPKAIVENCNKVKEGGTVIVEGIHRRKDGSTFPVEISLGMLQDENPALLLAIARDTTQRKQDEEALRESEEKHRFAMEATTDGLWDWKVLSGEVYYSPSWSIMLGELDVAPRYGSWEKRIHPDDKEIVLSSLQDHLKKRTGFWKKEHRLRTKTGEWKWVLGRGRVVERDENGQPLHMVGTMTDISDRKQAEETLQRKTYDLGERVKELNCLYCISSLIEKPDISLYEIIQGV